MRQAGMASFLALAAVGLSTAACASGSAEHQGPTAREASTVLEITNNNWLDMTIYVVHGSTRSRLGTVVSMMSERFALPRSVAMSDSHVRLIASPIGSREIYQTPPILVGEGTRITWQVENQLALSSFAVR